VDKFGEAPAGGTKTVTVGAEGTEVLRKSVPEGTKVTALGRKQIIQGLEVLYKSATGDEKARLMSSIIKYESSGSISDTDLLAVSNLRKSVAQ